MATAPEHPLNYSTLPGEFGHTYEDTPIQSMFNNIKLPGDFEYGGDSCPMLTANDHLLISSLEYWCSDVLSLIICTTGFTINLLILITIFKVKKLKQDVSQLLLLGLFSSDTFYLMLRIVYIFSQLLVTATYNSNVTLESFLYPLQLFALSCSIFMAVAITMERFVVVYTPLR